MASIADELNLCIYRMDLHFDFDLHVNNSLLRNIFKMERKQKWTSKRNHSHSLKLPLKIGHLPTLWVLITVSSTFLVYKRGILSLNCTTFHSTCQNYYAQIFSHLFFQASLWLSKTELISSSHCTFFYFKKTTCKQNSQKLSWIFFEAQAVPFFKAFPLCISKTVIKNISFTTSFAKFISTCRWFKAKSVSSARTYTRISIFNSSVSVFMLRRTTRNSGKTKAKVHHWNSVRNYYKCRFVDRNRRGDLESCKKWCIGRCRWSGWSCDWRRLKMKF